MLFSNPFFVAYIFFGVAQLLWVNYMNGVDRMPQPQQYNAMQITIGVCINWLWMALAILWEINH